MRLEGVGVLYWDKFEEYYLKQAVIEKFGTKYMYHFQTGELKIAMHST